MMCGARPCTGHLAQAASPGSFAQATIRWLLRRATSHRPLRRATSHRPLRRATSHRPLCRATSPGYFSQATCRNSAQFVANLPAKSHQGIILMPAQPGPGEKAPPGHKKVVRVITVQIIKPQQHILHGFHQAFLFRRCDQFAPSTLARRASAFFLLAITYGIGAFIQKQQNGLSQIERACGRVGGYGCQFMTMGNLFIIKPPVFRAKNQSNPFAPCQHLGHSCRSLRGSKQ